MELRTIALPGFLVTENIATIREAHDRVGAESGSDHARRGSSEVGSEAHDVTVAIHEAHDLLLLGGEDLEPLQGGQDDLLVASHGEEIDHASF
jgi:hypothetical protein